MKTALTRENLPHYFAIIPAAGIGARMGSETPKQYLLLKDKPILEHALTPLFQHPAIEKVIVVIHEKDPYWQKLGLNNTKIITTLGGMERCHSVFNGLLALQGIAQPNDWVLVHDAARPCLQQSDIDKLINALSKHPVGGILGGSVRDTVKKVSGHQITETIDRKDLWQAYTPQMFRYELLKKALGFAIKNHHIATDEAAAIELIGEKPAIIEGRRDNIKVTEPGDLKLAEFYLNQN